MQHVRRMKRRTVLQLGILGSVVVALGGGLALWSPALHEGRLSPEAREIFRAAARAVLEGALAARPVARDAELDAQVKRVEATLAGFPSHARKELSLLLGLLSTAPGRRVIARLDVGWAEASTDQLQQALQGMRTSSLKIRQQTYHALRDLTNGAFYVDPSHWAQVGYPGPPEL
jgi:hypothetical protein